MTKWNKMGFSLFIDYQIDFFLYVTLWLVRKSKHFFLILTRSLLKKSFSSCETKSFSRNSFQFEIYKKGIFFCSEFSIILPGKEKKKKCEMNEMLSSFHKIERKWIEFYRAWREKKYESNRRVSLYSYENGFYYFISMFRCGSDFEWRPNNAPSIYRLFEHFHI